MVSAWFREQQSAPVNEAPATAATEWWSPFDEGWRAAQALRAPLTTTSPQPACPSGSRVRISCPVRTAVCCRRRYPLRWLAPRTLCVAG